MFLQSNEVPADSSLINEGATGLSEVLAPEELMAEAAHLRSKRKWQDALAIYKFLSSQPQDVPGVKVSSHLAGRARAEQAFLTADNLGRQQEAIKLLQRAMEEMRTNIDNCSEETSKEVGLAYANAEVKLARLTRSTPAALPQLWVKSLFDDFASTFDKKLRHVLAYRAPEMLCDTILRHRQVQDGLEQNKQEFKACLDLGAGTGLLGEILRPHCTILEGVELSGEMAAKAEEKGVYDTLHVRDLHEHLKACLDMAPSSRIWDLIVACDVFNYIGCLGAVFSLVGQLLHLSPKAMFAFTTETMEARTAKELGSFRLSVDGRYEYTTGYIASLAQEAQLEVWVRKETVLRKNLGIDVKGHIWVLGSKDTTKSA